MRNRKKLKKRNTNFFYRNLLIHFKCDICINHSTLSLRSFAICFDATAKLFAIIIKRASNKTRCISAMIKAVVAQVTTERRRKWWQFFIKASIILEQSNAQYTRKDNKEYLEHKLIMVLNFRKAKTNAKIVQFETYSIFFYSYIL